MGVGRDGQPTDAYQPGMELHAKYTLFAEGCRGHLGKQLEDEVPPARRRRPAGLWHRHQGTVGGASAEQHQQGPGRAYRRLAAGRRHLWRLLHVPLRRRTWWRSASSSGWATAIPICRPSRSSSATRRIPTIRGYFDGGRRIAYGARALAAGGLQALPKLVFPGGCLIGDDAGFLNASRIKGIHGAIKSGMLAAEAVFDAVGAGRSGDELTRLSATLPQRAGCTTNCTGRATSSRG